MDILGGLKKIGKGIVDTAKDIYEDGKDLIVDAVEGTAELATDAVKIVKDVAIDSVDVVSSIFTDKSFKDETKQLANNFAKNTGELLSDGAEHALNTVNNVVQTGAGVIENANETLDNLIDVKGSDKIFDGIGSILKKIRTVNETYDHVHDNKEPIMDLIGTAVTTIVPNITKDNIKIAWDSALKKDSLPDGVKEFFSTLTFESGQEMFNNLVDTNNGKSIKDEDLTNINPNNGLSNRDLLVLSSFEYSNLVVDENNGKTLNEILKELHSKTGSEQSFENFEFTSESIKTLKDNFGFKIAGEITDKECADLFNEIKNSKSLSTLTILNNTDQEQNYITASTYAHLDAQGNLIDNATVVFRGTDSATAWADDFDGLVDGDTRMQQAADQYIKEQINGEYKLTNLTITGHSKGGNLAMYTTVLNEENVEACVSFNGQGFNDDFLFKYKNEINSAEHKITSVSSYADFINSTLTPIAGRTVYVDTDIRSTQIEDFTKFMQDSHSTSAMLKANKDGWIKKDSSDLSKLVSVICSSIEKMKEPTKSDIVEILTDLADEHLAKHSSVGDKNPNEFGAPIYALNAAMRLAQTSDGYNVYSMQSDNDTIAIATLDMNGDLISGDLSAYTNDECPTVDELKEDLKNSTNRLNITYANEINPFQNLLNTLDIQNLNKQGR